MEHNPISAGDIAMSMASDEQYRRKALEGRVKALEAELERVVEWSETIADALNTLNEKIDALAAKP